LACLLVIIGMYSSRALMSMGMILLFTISLFPTEQNPSLKGFLRQKHLLLITGYFLFMALTGLWSEDQAFFNQRIQIILPFLILPFAFYRLKPWTQKQFDRLWVAFICFTLGGIIWSLMPYFKNKEFYDISYGYSHLIPTPFEDDHIRFSLAVVLSICFGVDLLSRLNTKLFKFFLVLIILVDILYLHILSAKTGVVVFYLVSLLYMIHLIRMPKFRWVGLGMLLMMFVLPILMYMTSTSFRNKVGYVKYSISHMQNETKEANISDEGRLISYDYAFQSMKQHLWIGVGLGDVMNEMTNYFNRDFPGVKLKVLLPHNQFLMVGMAAGIFGLFYLILIMSALCLQIRKSDFLYACFFIMMFFTMMIEPLFETQYGTCMFLFFFLLLLHRNQTKNNPASIS
nr:O-antigen ligase family protein [Chitinophagaceae bacterium]